MLVTDTWSRILVGCSVAVVLRAIQAWQDSHYIILMQLSSLCTGV
jgi:hypothetical protein